VSELPASRLHESAPDALALVLWKYSHRPEPRPHHICHEERTVDDVAHHSTVENRDQRKQRRPVCSQGIDDVSFLVLSERASVDLSDGVAVAGLLLSDDGAFVMKAKLHQRRRSGTIA
jgi:hypothetical protein